MHARILTEAWQRENGLFSRFFVLALVAIIALLLATLPLAWAALVLIAAIFVTVVFVEPRWGLYILPFAVPFGSFGQVAAGPATVGATEGILGLFLAAWLARGVARREVRLRRPPLMAAILIWYLAMLLSTVNSLSLTASLKELIKWGETFALYAIAAQELRRRDILIVTATTLAAGTLAAAQGIVQSVLQIGPPGFLFLLAGRVWMRAYGQFIQPNPYAGYLGLVLPLAYCIVAVGIRAQEWTLARATGRQLARWLSATTLRAMALTAAAIMAVALFLTLSRGGWIGATVAAVVAGMLLSRRVALLSVLLLIMVVTGLALGAAQLLPEALANRATDFVPYINIFQVDVRGVQLTPANFAVIERLAHWQAALEMWADRPLLGYGIGNYAAAYPAYAISPWYDPLGHAHNLFLNTVAETGILGLGGYLLFWVSALAMAVRAVWRNTGLWRGLAVGVVGAMVHLHAHNFFDNLYVHGMYLHMALMLAIAAILSDEAGNSEETG
jgi:putative inorganic carbon (hco3(-)) transporter